MSSINNRFRKKWQDYCSKNSITAEQDFYNVFKVVLEGTEYEIKRKPQDFNSIYLDVELDKKELSEIYNPKEKIKRHGFIPDFVIINNNTGKSIYIEVKRQDGWIEGKTRYAGRGNAHERLCKYFVPSILSLLRNKTKIKEKEFLPFLAIFLGDITRDPCRVKEINFWFNGFKHNYFFWRNSANAEELIKHFENYIVPMLD